MVPRFGRPIPELGVTANHTIDLVLISGLGFFRYTHAVHQAGAALPNCWGFVDGSVRPVSRPGKTKEYFTMVTKSTLN